jgi:hypothetical protein
MPRRDAAALTLRVVVAWETVGGASVEVDLAPAPPASVDVDVAPAPPVMIATAAATATSVKILVHPNIEVSPLVYAMPQPQPQSIEGAAPVLRSSPRFSRANNTPGREGAGQKTI